MGSVVSFICDYCPEELTRGVWANYKNAKKKRKRVPDDEAEMRRSLFSPKRKKLQCTADYIYQALFVEGKDSDVTVNILDHPWKLHKIYLRQSQYFSSMFSGSWNESDKAEINIEVADSNVTPEALKTVFGSFYLDEITLEPNDIIGVIAAATLFQMEGLIEQCSDMMIENVCPLTAVNYYHAACRYGLTKVKNAAIEWFLVNLTDYYSKNKKRLKEIDFDLMTAIITHPKLRVVPTEITLYQLLKTWIFMKLNPTWSHSEDCSIAVDKFFRNREGDKVFLMNKEGEQYVHLFKCLRLTHLLLHVQDLNAITADKIIPESWILEACKRQWISLLHVTFEMDRGPTVIDEEYFNKECLRFGRVVYDSENRSWRWNWLLHGIDLIWSIMDNNIIIKRKRMLTVTTTSTQSLPHNMLTKVEVFNLDSNRQVKRKKETEVLLVSLNKNQEQTLLQYGPEFEYPLYIVMNLMLTKPSKTENSAQRLND